MLDMATTASRCMDAIRERVGTVEFEMFIYYIRSQAFDYTAWQRERYDSKTPEELFASLEDLSASHQFEGKKAVVI